MKRIYQHGKNSPLGPLGNRFSKKIIYIIGLPGVGKTTVGNIIAKRTGFILFDHNITYKEICHFLEKGTRPAHLLNGQLHIAIMNLFLNSELPGVVCTVSVRHQPTSQTVLNALRLIKRMGAQVNFIKIVCDWDEHKRRIRSPSRRVLGKTNTIQKLKKFMGEPRFEGFKKYPPWVVNNTNIPANKCAEIIIATLGLSNGRVK